LQHFQHNGRRQAVAALAIALALAGRIDEVFGPAIQDVGPILALRHRKAVLLGDVITDLADAADHVLRTHVLQDGFEGEQLPALEVSLHVVHDGRNVGAVLQLLLRKFVEHLFRLGCGPTRFDAEGFIELVADFSRHDVLLA